MSERWKPEYKDIYYYISESFTVEVDCNENTFTDKERIYCGNCFKTEEEAYAAAEKVQALLLSLHEPSTECSKLPKLTTEIFNRSYFPKTAEYAVVTKDGSVTAYTHKPYINEEIPCWGFNRGCSFTVETAGSYDASDWQNSLIERHAKHLPDWCKFGVVGWHKRARYFKVCADDELARRISIQQIDDKSRGWLSYETMCTEVKQARIRPYTAYEMRGLIGKVVGNERGNLFVVTAFVADDGGEVCVDGVVYNADDLLECYTVDEHPCGKLEHLENGEWVE